MNKKKFLITFLTASICASSLIGVVALPPLRAEAAMPNLIPNPSVEIASTTTPGVPTSWRKGGSGANTRILTYPVPGFDGAKAARTEITSYTAGDAKWYFDEIPVTPGKTYTFSDYYQSNAISYLTFQYRRSDNTLSYPDLLRDIPAAPSWTQVTKSFTVPTTPAGGPAIVSLTLFHLVKSVGWITVDAYSMTEVDTVPPAVSLTAPVSSSTVSSTVTIHANATDANGIAGVQFLLDSAPLGSEVTAAPYDFSWNTASTSDGVHSLKARARDLGGNSTTSTQVTVTVSNAPPPPPPPATSTITVAKIVINNDGGTSTIANFPLFVGTSSVTSGVPVTFAPGTYIISETSNPNYAASFSGDCSALAGGASGTLTVAAGESKQCTITNNDVPPPPPPPPATSTITVTKVVINDNGATSTISDFSLFVNATSVISGVSNIFASGTYQISETSNQNYAASFSGDCSALAGGASGTLTLAAGESKQCTITNDDIPPPPPATSTITVTKVVINDNAGTSTVSDFPLSVGTTTVSSGVPATFAPGTYTISEISNPNYTSSFSGDCSASGTLVIVAGESKLCTITNNDVPPSPPPTSLTISMTILNDNGDGGFTSPSDFSVFVDGSAATSEAPLAVTPGAHVVTQTSDPNYTTTFSGDCDATGHVSVAAGESKECHIVNDDIPPPPPPPPSATLTVTAVVINNDGGTSTVANFPLFVGTSSVTSGVTSTFTPGGYVVSEMESPRYTTTFSEDCDAGGFVTLSDGGVESCTVTNDDIPLYPNLISNPSVETASSTGGVPTNWKKGGYGTNNRVLSYPVAGQDGAKAVKIQITSYTNGDAKWYFNEVPVVPGREYSFSDWYQSSLGNIPEIRVTFANGSLDYITFGTLAATSAWAQFSASFVAPANAVSVTAFHLIQGVGTLTTDNYSIREVPPPPPPDPTNPIVNPSVETVSASSPGLPASWNKGGYGNNNRILSYPVPGVDGAKAIKAEITNYTDGDAKWYFADVPVSPGDIYTYSDRFLSNVGSYLSLRYLNGDGSYSYYDLGRPLASSTWQQFSVNFTVPAGAVSLTIFHSIKSVGAITLDDYRLRKLPPSNFAQGMVTLDFDDGLLSQFQSGKPILDAAGLHGSFFIITENLNLEDGSGDFTRYITPAQVVELQTAGHEVGGHTRTHPHLSQLSEADMRSEITGSYNDLVAMGIAPVGSFVYPYGAYNPLVKSIVAESFPGSRSVAVGYNDRYADPYALKDQHIDASATLPQVEQWIDTAVANKTWLVLELHEIDESGALYSNTPELLQAIVDYLVAHHVMVVTQKEGLSLLNN